MQSRINGVTDISISSHKLQPYVLYCLFVLLHLSHISQSSMTLWSTVMKPSIAPTPFHIFMTFWSDSWFLVRIILILYIVFEKSRLLTLDCADWLSFNKKAAPCLLFSYNYVGTKSSRSSHCILLRFCVFLKPTKRFLFFFLSFPFLYPLAWVYGASHNNGAAGDSASSIDELHDWRNVMSLSVFWYIEQYCTRLSFQRFPAMCLAGDVWGSLRCKLRESEI